MSIVLTSTEQPRPPVSETIKDSIRRAFEIVPPGKKAAVIGIADLGNGNARLLGAVNAGTAWGAEWKVGGQIGIMKGARRPDGDVFVAVSW